MIYQVSTCKIGCISGVHLGNHLMYADDRLLCPYSWGFNILLKHCS